MADNDEKFRSWAVVEVMGHKRLAGFVEEVTIAGAGMLRVDVPETTHVREAFDSVRDGDEWTKPGYTKFVGGASVYCLTPCSEDVARIAAQQIERFNEPLPVSLPKQLPAIAASSRDDDADDAFEVDLHDVADDDDDDHDLPL